MYKYVLPLPAWLYTWDMSLVSAHMDFWNCTLTPTSQGAYAEKGGYIQDPSKPHPDHTYTTPILKSNILC